MEPNLAEASGGNKRLDKLKLFRFIQKSQDAVHVFQVCFQFVPTSVDGRTVSALDCQAQVLLLNMALNVPFGGSPKPTFHTKPLLLPFLVPSLFYLGLDQAHNICRKHTSLNCHAYQNG